MPITETVHLHYLRMAPRKVRAIAGVIRGLPVNEAEAHLAINARRAAKPLLKLLRSGIANLKQNRKVDAAGFAVAEIRVDPGPMLKRALPRARGVATPIQRKMSHVTLVLAERPGAAERFTIIRPKKAKAPAPERKTTRKRPAAEGLKEKETAEPKREKGFFRRIFNRKAMGGS